MERKTREWSRQRYVKTVRRQTQGSRPAPKRYCIVCLYNNYGINTFNTKKTKSGYICETHYKNLKDVEAALADWKIYFRQRNVIRWVYRINAREFNIKIPWFWWLREILWFV